ncbi:prepilin peptidase [Pelobacter propionicus]|uniref:Prepilin leader peptidase/N-methyltransferase n=1 Tax=Pelobacter propionicus (strain DSM 2379 / NBRC 103807 / OttBd1) TaxID=338966 RepID=A1AMP0_PELPD|nr:A24 family peptidase [Pelobacter propionicus]ABK98610.1 type 4 prepilin peptidase 1, Aspartic peptidase, MEROPS family A24A [Pelobacter propionicus DSM 2379]
MTPQLLFSVFSFILGAVVGSFLNVCICRMPRDESVVSPPSHCPGCGYRIRWYDNIPLVSYLLLRGRCRGCREKISPRYPLVELLNALLSLALFLRFGPTLAFAVLFLFCSALVVITFIDLEHQIIPDEISLPGIVLGFIFSFFLRGHGWLNSLLGILLGGGSLLLVAYGYQLVTGKEGMGGGDIKLLAMMGAFLGWKSIPFIIFVSSLAGSVIGVSLMLIQKKDSKLAIPFGPYLALGALLYVFYGPRLISWYLTLGGLQG